MQRWLYLFVLMATIAGSYVWLKLPELAAFGPQLFLAALLGYILSRKIMARVSADSHQATFLLSQFESWDTALLVLATIMLVGSTGTIGSAFFAANYVLLFFVVFSSGDLAALATGLALSIAYFGMSTNITQSAISPLLSLPLVSLLFTLAKNQYLLAVKATSNLLHDDDWNSQRSESTGWFLQKFLQPTVVHLKELMGNPKQNQSAILEQLIRIEHRTEQLLEVYRSKAAETVEISDDVAATEMEPEANQAQDE